MVVAIGGDSMLHVKFDKYKSSLPVLLKKNILLILRNSYAACHYDM